ncbi:MAG: ATP-binding protein [Prolixibacteraceae bacterium]|nr:ATP-binding protein [Prolixibacteraceae bacterium]MBN2775417.1 ATP-binding protein [Prolixibacteraceae bacterium]
MNKVRSNNELIIYSEIGHLEKIKSYLQNIVGKMQIKESAFNRILLCVSEAVTNAIIHGNRNNENKSVKIESTLNDSTLSITISDEGRGFDYTGIPDPTKLENLKKEKGRGLFIINFYSKEIYFFNNGSTINIKFDLSENTIL